MRSFFATLSAALVLAVVTLIGPASTAALADGFVNYPMGTAGGGTVQLSLEYDPATLLIQNLVLVNNGTKGTITLEILDRTTGAVIDTVSRTAGTGTFRKDVTGRNLHMIHETGVDPKYGLPYDTIVPPFGYSIEWSSR